MTISYDLAPATAQLARIADGVNDDQMGPATPCEDWPPPSPQQSIRSPSRQAPDLDGDLPADWKGRLYERPDALVAAWRASKAWQGEAEAGGVILPAETTGGVVLDELVLHGWDLARATGHPDPASVRLAWASPRRCPSPARRRPRGSLRPGRSHPGRRCRPRPAARLRRPGPTVDARPDGGAAMTCIPATRWLL